MHGLGVHIRSSGWKVVLRLETLSGFLSAPNAPLKVYETYGKKKPKVPVRFKNGKVVEVDSERVRI